MQWIKRLHRPGLFIALSLFATALCGCPPLNYKIYARNNTTDSAHVILLYSDDVNLVERTIAVRSGNGILDINKKTFSKLADTLSAMAGNGRINLTIPPNSTVFLTDLVQPVYICANKSLIIQSFSQSDTIPANYPYRGLDGFKQKSDPSYNYFYRTIIYFDIK